MILLAGSLADGPVACVLAALQRAGVEPVLVDFRTPLLDGWLYGRGSRVDATVVQSDGVEIGLADVHAVYARVLDHRRFAGYIALEPEARQGCDRAHEALAAFLELGGARVLNPAAAMASNRSKPYQIQLIRQLGFDVPATLVTNEPEAVREFLDRHRRVVFKSASAVRSIVRELDSAALARLSALRACPVQFQALVPGLDVRVHVVGRAVFATACASTVVDYRYAGSEGSLVPYDLPGELAERCVQLAQSLGLPVAGVDLKLRPDGGWTCFEVNPSPGFSWFEHSTGQPISDAIARLMLEA
jgi:glutathione synthase/RimK-type ligase-like ATP-grasp enzyme